MMIGIGIDARIVEGIDPRLKRASGKFAYVWSGIRAIVKYRPAAYRLIIDGKPHDAAVRDRREGPFLWRPFCRRAERAARYARRFTRC